MIECKCTKCDNIYTLSGDYIGNHIRCKICGHVIEIKKISASEIMPDFNSLFIALAEQERQAPALKYNKIGA